MKPKKSFAWLTSRNTNKLHAILTVNGEYKIGCRSLCGIGAYTFWYVGSEGLDKCKNCLRKIGEMQ